jgi:hypothetical protein
VTESEAMEDEGVERRLRYRKDRRAGFGAHWRPHR